MKNEVVGDCCVVGGSAVDGVNWDCGSDFARSKKTQTSCLRYIWVAVVIAGVLTAEGAGFAERALSYASGYFDAPKIGTPKRRLMRTRGPV